MIILHYCLNNYILFYRISAMIYEYNHENTESRKYDASET